MLTAIIMTFVCIILLSVGIHKMGIFESFNKLLNVSLMNSVIGVVILFLIALFFCDSDGFLRIMSLTFCIAVIVAMCIAPAAVIITCIVAILYVPFKILLFFGSMIKDFVDKKSQTVLITRPAHVVARHILVKSR
jgi:hypothetical protein